MSWWPGDGNAYDIVGGNHGTLVNGAGFGPRMVEQAFSLDGVDDSVVLDHTKVNFPDATTPATVNAWVRMNGDCSGINPMLAFGDRDGGSDSVPYNDLTINIGHFAGKWDDEQVFVSRIVNSSIEMGLATRLATGGVNVFDGQWHMVTVAFGTELKIYVDGMIQTLSVNVGGNNGRFGGIPNADYADIGALERGPEEYHFDGQIDELQIYDRELLPEEIRAVFNAGAAGLCKAPVKLVESVVAQVVALNLVEGISNSLDAKLDAALNALDDVNANNDVAAINSMQAFINAVEAQRGQKIPEEDADALIGAALAIVGALVGL